MRRIGLRGWVWVLCLVICACALGFLAGRMSSGRTVRVQTEREAQSGQTAGLSAADAALPETEQAAKPTLEEETETEQTAEADAEEKMEPVELNAATKEELMRLPGIGPTLAERILVYREEYGRFVTTQQLMDVDGIGEATYEALRTLVTVEGEYENSGG